MTQWNDGGRRGHHQTSLLSCGIMSAQLHPADNYILRVDDKDTSVNTIRLV